MNSALAVGISAAVLMGLIPASPVLPAEAFGGNDGRRLTVDSQPPMHGRIVSVPPRRLPMHVQTPRPYPPHHFGPRRDGFGRHRQGFIASGPAVYYWPGYVVDSGPAYAEPTYYAPSPAYWSPSVSAPVPPPPPAPPAPSVIEHPTGRYELRGDGISTPYTWVWVPNPPPAPPGPPEPAPAASRPAVPLPRSSLYTWTDRDGVVHWTDNANLVPEEYRSKVQKRSL